MKKILLALGTFVTIFTPLTVVVSCSNNQKELSIYKLEHTPTGDLSEYNQARLAMYEKSKNYIESQIDLMTTKKANIDKLAAEARKLKEERFKVLNPVGFIKRPTYKELVAKVMSEIDDRYEAEKEITKEWNALYPPGKDAVEINLYEAQLIFNEMLNSNNIINDEIRQYNGYLLNAKHEIEKLLNKGLKITKEMQKCEDSPKMEVFIMPL